MRSYNHQVNNTGSSQGYGSYGNATVSHLPPGYNQPLGAGRHAPQHTLGSSQQRGVDVPVYVQDPRTGQYSRSPSPQPGSHSGQLSMGMSTSSMQPSAQQQQYVPQTSHSHQMQQPTYQSSMAHSSMGQYSTQQQQMPSGLNVLTSVASDYSQQYQSQNQYEQSRGVSSGITASGLTNSATINSGMTTSGLTNSAFSAGQTTSSGLTSNRYDQSQNTLGMSGQHTLGANTRVQNQYDSQMNQPMLQ